MPADAGLPGLPGLPGEDADEPGYRVEGDDQEEGGHEREGDDEEECDDEEVPDELHPAIPTMATMPTATAVPAIRTAVAGAVAARRSVLTSRPLSRPTGCAAASRRAACGRALSFRTT
jgi:hypothetical protein